LNIIIFFKLFDEPENLCRIVVFKDYRCFGKHADFVRARFQNFYYGLKILRCRGNVNNAVRFGHVFGAAFDCRFLNFVKGEFVGINRNDALSDKKPRKRTRFRQFRARAGKNVTQIRSRPVAIIGKNFDKQRCFSEKGFLRQFFVIHAFKFARSFLYRVGDIVFGHTCAARFENGGTQSRLSFGIAAVDTGSIGNFPDQFAERLSASRLFCV
jgi:hypothetical protein